MAIFKKKEQDEIRKAGGVMEIKGSAVKNEKGGDAAQLVKDITEGKTAGFFFVLARDGNQSEGIARFNKVSKEKGLEVFLRAIRLPLRDVLLTSLLVETMSESEAEED